MQRREGEPGSRSFEQALRRVSERLELPQPERTRILEEIAIDLEELRIELMDRGLSPGEAEARAVRLLAPSETAIDALAHLHEPFYRKLTRRFSPSTMLRVERAALLLVTVGTLAYAVAEVLESGVLNDPSPFLWAVFALAGAILLLTGKKTIQLLFRRNHAPATLRSGLGVILLGSGAAMGAGVAGLLLELLELTTAVQRTGEASTTLVIPWLLDSSALLSASLITALIGGLCWYLLLQKVEGVEQAHQRAAMLLEGTSSPTALSISEFDDSRTFNRQGA